MMKWERKQQRMYVRRFCLNGIDYDLVIFKRSPLGQRINSLLKQMTC
jgi:hypothetical protein